MEDRQFFRTKSSCIQSVSTWFNATLPLQKGRGLICIECNVCRCGVKYGMVEAKVFTGEIVLVEELGMFCKALKGI